MTRTPFDVGAKLDQLLARHRAPSPDRLRAAIDRVGRQVGAAEIRVAPPAIRTNDGSHRGWLTAAAVLLLAAVVGAAILWRPAAEPIFRVVEGDVYQGDPPSLLRSSGGTGMMRSNGGGGAVLALSDASRVEMRSNSELAVERATDGLRIRLRQGGIIVNAAERRTGHLYVQTKDMTVSVVGTVFVVNADDQGSRVAVVEGEVRVQRGATETKLRPGERVATTASEAFTVASELAWSRRAASLVALLEKSAVEQQFAAAAPQTPREPRVAFEVSSVRPSGDAPAPASGARGSGGGGGERGAINGCSPSSSGYRQQLDPTRLAVTRATLFQLIAWAYPIPGVPDLGPFGLCVMLSKQVEMISGGPAWLKADLWDLEARIPEGLFSTKPVNSDPKLLLMLQDLLVNRFKLTMRRETRNVSVYLLKVGTAGTKFNGRRVSGRGPLLLLDRTGKPLPDQEARAADGQITMSPRRLSDGGFSNYVDAYNVSMEQLARELTGVLDRPVLDRTGLTGRFDFHHASDVQIDLADPDKLESGMAAARRAVVKGVGLELEESKAPFDVWIIERADKPTAN